MNMSRQKGFTLIELIIAMAISAMIFALISMAVYQTMTISVKNNNHMIAVREVQSAGFWISRDVQQAQASVQAIDTNDYTGSGTVEILSLAWDDSSYGGTESRHNITYTLSGGVLVRQDTVGAQTTSINIATDINTITWQTVGTAFRATITAGTSGFQPVTDTEIYEFEPRAV